MVLQTLRVANGVSEQESVQVQITRLLVESYYDIVRRSLQDSVPKAIMHFLVLCVQRGLQQHLIRTLYRCLPLPLIAPNLWLIGRRLTFQAVQLSTAGFESSGCPLSYASQLCT